MNDNFESKFNNRSTPKKPQNNNEIFDKKNISVDVIFNELQSTKNETSNAIISSNVKIESIEEKLKRIDTDITRNNELSRSNLDNLVTRMTQIEAKLENVTQLRTNFETLKTKVDQLSVEFQVIKKINDESKMSYEDIVAKMDQSFNNIHISIEENFGVIDKIMNANFTQSRNLIDQLNEGTNLSISKYKTSSNTPLLEQPKAIDIDTKSPQVDCKSSLFCKPQSSQPNKDLKPKGDSTEHAKDLFITNASKPNNTTPTLNSKQEGLKTNEKLCTTINKSDDTTKTNLFDLQPSENQKTTEKTNFAVKVDAGNKNAMFGFQAKPDTQKSIFSNPNQPSIFSKTTPTKSESTVTTSGIFSGLQMTFPARSNEPLFGNLCQTGKLQTNLFASKPIDSVDNVTTSIFNKATLFKPETNEKKSEPVSTIFGANTNAQSFSFQSETKPVGFGDSTEASWKAGSKLFGKNKSMTEEAQHEESFEEEHDPHFQPIIELPPLVHVTNDEESHDILFRNRCKLYRFINNEWKERGVGDMKIMQSKPEYDASRPVILVMRREQIRKICCNQRVSKDCPIFAAMPNATNKSTCWVATDYSEDEPKQEKFAVKFSSEDVLKEFQNVIARVQSELGASN